MSTNVKETTVVAVLEPPALTPWAALPVPVLQVTRGMENVA